MAVIGLATTGFLRAEDVPATFSGGHDIGKNDHGRPCVLIAAALGGEYPSHPNGTVLLPFPRLFFVATR